MNISDEQTRYIARLARLQLDDETTAHMSRELGAILTYVEKLDQLDTESVAPTAHVLDVHNVWREDVAKELPHHRQLLLEQAPHFEDGFFIVPKVIE